MAGSASFVDSGSLVEGTSSGNRCVLDESLMEYRSCGQVENGTPSTSPPYWDTDDDDDDCGPKPSALYGKFTWKIEKFSQINKRELRSNAFEVGGYKWYILIYPQGCDVCNHLSLFLCVSNHDKLLPGWSYFAQFTIAVVNKDPKKSKYSDTLHRFWKKEHDWGWKKFMELSKVLDGFINDDSLVIKAQVQVIREKTHRLFRCLDCQYRRELVRVYLSNVDQICRRFIEERKGKFSKLIEDKIRWPSFRAFWIGTNQIARKHMSRDKTDAILKVVVKHFFVEKEVTSTLVMDSLYSGLKVLEYQSKSKKGRTKPVEIEEFPASMVHIENDMFVLADDVLQLLERVALGPMPLQPSTPKDDKSSQNRAKDGSSGDEFNKDSIERVERRLTEFGLRVLEFFVIAHIFSSKIEVAYQEEVALKRQEELIREEEAAEQAEIELKAKRNAAEKERRNKKKQAKQRKNSRKEKDRAKDEKSDTVMHEKHQQESPSTEISLEHFSCRQEVVILDKYGTSENASDTSDTGDAVSEIIQPDLDERECSLVSWDTDTSEIHHATENSNCMSVNGQAEKKAAHVMDDSSSTCSTDSVASVVMTGSFKGNSSLHSRSQVIPKIGKKHQYNDTQNRPSDVRNLRSASGSSRAPRAEPEAVVSLNDRIQWLEHLVGKEEATSTQKKLNVNDQADSEQPSNSSTVETSSSLGSSRNSPYISPQQPKQCPENATTNTKPSSITVQAVPVKVPTSYSTAPSSTPSHHATRSPQISVSKSEAQNPTKSSTAQQTPSISRPSSAPLIPPARPTVPSVSTVQTSPLLSRSVSATGRLGTDPSPSAPSFVPQSYRNAITGKNDQFVSLSAQPFVSSTAAPPPRLTFGSMKPRYDPEPSSSSKQLDIYSESRARKQHQGGMLSSIRSFPPQSTMCDEFPHLDIINELLDEDKGIGTRAANLQYDQHQLMFHRNYSFPGDMDVGSFGQMQFDPMEQYYDERAYGSLSGLRDGPYSHVDLAAYVNGPFDGLSPNQWPYSASDLSMLGSGGIGGVGGYPYQLPNYSSGLNAYMYPRPGSGHL